LRAGRASKRLGVACRAPDILAADFAHRVTSTDVGADTLLTIDGDLPRTILLTGIGSSKVITEKDFVL
jgi:hypothetical protein